jgi:diguanylate cyclase
MGLPRIHEEKARTDLLTGLPTCRALADEIDRHAADFYRQRRPISVVMIDVDHLKRLNDAHGHRMGDKALKIVAEILQGGMRQSDMIARYGGDQFVAVLPDVELPRAARIADRLRRIIEEKDFGFAGIPSQVTASFGVAELREGEEASDMLQRADEALLAAKQAGRNCAQCHDGRRI